MRYTRMDLVHTCLYCGAEFIVPALRVTSTDGRHAGIVQSDGAESEALDILRLHIKKQHPEGLEMFDKHYRKSDEAAG